MERPSTETSSAPDGVNNPSRPIPVVSRSVSIGEPKSAVAQSLNSQANGTVTSPGASQRFAGLLLLVPLLVQFALLVMGGVLLWAVLLHLPRQAGTVAETQMAAFIENVRPPDHADQFKKLATKADLEKWQIKIPEVVKQAVPSTPTTSPVEAIDTTALEKSAAEVQGAAKDLKSELTNLRSEVSNLKAERDKFANHLKSLPLPEAPPSGLPFQAEDLAVLIVAGSDFDVPQAFKEALAQIMKKQLRMQQPSLPDSRHRLYVVTGGDVGLIFDANLGLANDELPPQRSVPASTATDDLRQSSAQLIEKVEFSKAAALKRVLIIARPLCEPPSIDDQFWKGIHVVDALLLDRERSPRREEKLDKWSKFCADKNGIAIMLDKRDDFKFDPRVAVRLERLLLPAALNSASKGN